MEEGVLPRHCHAQSVGPKSLMKGLVYIFCKTISNELGCF
jgi:hypothetical protein